MKSVNWVNAQRFDPEAKDGEPWTNLAAILAEVLEMNPGKPLSVPIDPASIASQKHPGRPWGLAQSNRLVAALSLLELIEKQDFQTLRTIADRLEIIRSNGMPAINPAGTAFVEAFENSHRENRPLAKSDFAKAAEDCGLNVPPSNKRRDFYAKYGLSDFARYRPKRYNSKHNPDAGR